MHLKCKENQTRPSYMYLISHQWQQITKVRNSLYN